MLIRDDIRHQAGNAGPDINGRIVIRGRQGTGKDDMSVQDTANRVRDGLVGIVALHQNRIHAGNGAFFKVAAALQQLGQLRVNRRRIATGHRRFSHRQPDLALGHGEARQRVHHQQHVVALIPEILSDAGSHRGTLFPQHSGLIGGRHHQDGAGHALLPQVLLYKIQNLTATFAHQRNDIDIRLDIFGDHAHQGTLAHAGAGEDADTLTLADGQQTVNGLHAELHTLPNRRSGKRVDVVPLDAVGRTACERSLPIDGLAQGVDDTAPEKRPHLQRQLPASVADKIARGNPSHVRIGHEQDVVILEAHDLCRELDAGFAVVDPADIPHGGTAAGGLDGHPHDVFNFSSQAVCLRLLQLLDHLSEQGGAPSL